MQHHKPSLREYRKNVYSQNGEDGVIAEICGRLDIRTGALVEFGAWDGIAMSNSYHLLEQGWSGVMIEGHEHRFPELQANCAKFDDRVTTLQSYVAIEGSDSLDNLLAKTDLKREFELLSIDIDSFDWHIWHSLQNYQPKIVVIEINSAVPVGVYRTHRDLDLMPLDRRMSGSSFSSTVALGKSKGYTPVCHTGNVIFVRDDLVDALQLPPVEREHPEVLFDYIWSYPPFQRQGRIWRRCLGMWRRTRVKLRALIRGS